MVSGIDRIAKSISTNISTQKNTYINNRIVDNALKLGDTFSNSKKAKYLSKVAKKANSDWLNANKIKNFVMNNSKNVVKGGIIGAAIIAVAGIFSSIVSHTVGKKAVA